MTLQDLLSQDIPQLFPARFESDRYLIEGLPAGDYVVFAEFEGVILQDQESLSDDRPGDEVAFHFGSSAISARICSPQGSSRNRFHIEIQVVTPEDEYFIQEQTWEATQAGAIFFRALPPGRVNFFWQIEDDDQTIWGTQSLLLPDRKVADVELGPCSTHAEVRGTLRTLSGHSVPFARIALTRKDSHLSERFDLHTKADGSFRAFLPSGLFEAEGVAFRQRDLPMAAGSQTNFDAASLRLPLELVVAGCTVVVRFPVEPEELNWIGASLTLEGEDPRFSSNRVTSIDGKTFVFPGLGPGRYDIEVRGLGCGGGIYARESVQVEPGEILREVDLLGSRGRRD